MDTNNKPKLSYKEGQLLRSLFWSGYHKKRFTGKSATYKEFTEHIINDINVRGDRAISISYIHAFLRKATENGALVFHKHQQRNSYFFVNRDFILEWLQDDEMFKRDLEIIEEMNLLLRR